MASIDILLPYWGEFPLFKETVDSILKQSSADWRLLIADDCYPSSEAREYIDSLNDSRITYHRHEQNIGITRNFNYCAQAASAPYCVLIGCDDRMLPNFVETALKNIGDADFYQPGVEIIDANGAVYLPLTDRVKRLLMPKKSGLYQGEDLAASLCRGNWLYFPSVVWKTSTLKMHPFNTEYKIVEDFDVEQNILLDGGTLYFDTTKTFQYRRFAASLSSREKGKSGIRFEEEHKIHNLLAKKFSDKGWRRAEKAAKLRLVSRINQIISR
ncbi:glycosyltransferase family 2 protein [Candidatus Saccharibacteria bacterium]|nr:glycosyltransferase family 2 protein [Candidatus Saccharibacteria bacterium]